MPDLVRKRALVVLAVGVGCATLAPVATASITPTLTLTQSTTQAGAFSPGTTGTTGSTGLTGLTGVTGLPGLGLTGVTGVSALPLVKSANATRATSSTPVTLGMDVKFAPSAGDAPKDVTLALPQGLLDDASIDNGACLTSSTAQTVCQVASGTATTGVSPATMQVPVTMDLVKAPSAGDVAGLALNATLPTGAVTLATGDITVRPASDPAGVGLNVTFSNLPVATPISELNVTFSGIRMPATCPSTAANVTLTADSQMSSTKTTAGAPLHVTGCASLPFAPALTAVVAKGTGTSAAVLTTVTQAADESPSSEVKIVIPSNLSPNVIAAAGLICQSPNATFSNCTPVGKAAADTPLLPRTQAGKTSLVGNVYVTGSVASPVMTIAFSAPFALQINGAISIITNSVDFTHVPDVPLTSLAVFLAGGSNSLFTTTCSPASSTATATFTDANGDKTASSSAPFTIAGCSSTGPTGPTGPTSRKHGKPTLSGSFTGVASGKPALKVTLHADSNGAPGLASATISAPHGVSFVKAKIATAVSVSGGMPKSVTLNGGKLVVVLSSASSSFTVNIAASALKVSKSLATKIVGGKVKTLTLSVSVKDAKGQTTRLTQKLSV